MNSCEPWLPSARRESSPLRWFCTPKDAGSVTEGQDTKKQVDHHEVNLRDDIATNSSYYYHVREASKSKQQSGLPLLLVSTSNE